MASATPTAPASARLSWLDGMKGISILWIAFFHFFGTYANGRYPDPLRPHYFSSFFSHCAPSSVSGTLGCSAQAFFVATSLVGFHAVAVFLVLSGFGLTYSLARTGEPDGGWRGWYRGRLLRLFPMYWVAHLVYLVSPFIARPEPLDYRFVLSFLGDRVYPVDMIFFYANPALWYFGLLLELYLVFPLLFRLLQKLGVTWFLVACGLETLVSRYLLLYVIPASGNYLLGAFFGTRLWEFAAGMALGLLYRRQRAVVEERLFNGWTFFGGVVIYVLGLYSYATSWSYTVTDACIGTGLSIILAHVALWSGLLPPVERTLAHVGAFSYGLYLLHQPYVIYFGERMRGLSLPTFTVLACAIIAALALGAIPLERYVNQLTGRVLDRKKESRPPVKEGARQPAA
jgi:peptidoglycan/LPS O-acetylase OafA/YrhL